MLGCRPLTRQEQASLQISCTGRHALRNRAIIALGCNTGFRISELLSLNIGDVASSGHVLGSVEVKRRHTKGRHQSRRVVINPEARTHLQDWLCELRNRGGLTPEHPLFPSSTGKRVTRFEAYKVIRQACHRAGVDGKVATHSLRKSFAARVYDHYLAQVATGAKVDPFRLTSKTLGHGSIESTDRYLSFRQDDVDAAVLAIGATTPDTDTKSQNSNKQG